MKIFLDTNVMVSAVATRGLCADVVREVFTSHQLVISVQLLTELQSILPDKFGVPDNSIEEFIELLHRDAHYIPSAPLLAIDIQDTDDIIILSSALQGNADLFVTGDTELLDLKKISDMEIVSPRQFWEKLRALESE